MKLSRDNRDSANGDISLAKKLNVLDYFSIGFGSIIGVGWVIMIGDWINLGGGVFSTIAAFIAGAFVLLPIALAYGELSVDMPVAGGSIVYSLKAFGSFPSYLTGWFLALGYITMCPWETIAIGQILEALFPVIRNYPLYSIGEYTLHTPTLFISLLISLVVIIINYRGIEHVTKLQNFLTLALFTIAIISVIISMLNGSFHNMMPIMAQTSKNQSKSFIKGFFSVLAITPFFYSGFDTIPQGIEEQSENTSSNSIGNTILFSVIAACIFYTFIIIAISIILPWQKVVNMNIPASDVYDIGLKLPFVSKLILVGALCGLITTLNSFYIAGARVLLTLGRAKFINELFSRIHPVYKTPYFSNLIIAFFTLLGPFLGKQLLLPFTNVCSFGFMIAWLMVCLSSIKLKNKACEKLNKNCIIRYLSAILSIMMIIILILPSSPGALKWPIEWGLVMIWSAIGIILYFVSNSKTLLISNEERQKRVLGKFYHHS